MIFINDTRNRDNWLYFSNRPKCYDSFIPGQTRSVGTLAVPCLYMIGMAVKSSESKKSSISPPRPSIEYGTSIRNPQVLTQPASEPYASTHSECKPRLRTHSTKKNLLRAVLLIIPCLPLAPLFLGFELFVVPNLPDSLKYHAVNKSLLFVAVYFSMSAYFGYAISALKDRLFSKCKALEDRDQLDIADLPIKQNKSIHRPDIRKQAYECELPVSGRDKQAGQADHIDDLQPRVVGLSPAIKYRS